MKWRTPYFPNLFFMILHALLALMFISCRHICYCRYKSTSYTTVQNQKLVFLCFVKYTYTILKKMFQIEIYILCYVPVLILRILVNPIWVFILYKVGVILDWYKSELNSANNFWFRPAVKELEMKHADTQMNRISP